MLLVHRGTDVKEIGIKEYILFPPTSSRFKEDSALSDWSVDDNSFNFACITLEHVNPHSGEAEFESLVVSVSRS